MDSNTKQVLYFGDQTDPFIDGIDQLSRQAAGTPWLQKFLDDMFRVVKEESRGMSPFLQKIMGEYCSLLDLADRYRNTPDEVGMARSFLLHAARAGMLLQWAKQEPRLLDATATQPERIGISGGLTNLVTLAVASDFESLYDAVIEAARIFARLCIFNSVKSRAVEDRPGHWGCAILGIPPDELRVVLSQYQESMGIPFIKQARVGVTGDRWSTIFAPPSILELVITQCPALRNLPKNDLSIHALQHVVAVSDADIEYIVGNAALLRKPVNPNFRIWGMDKPEVVYATWGHMVRAVMHQVLSVPLDIPTVMGQLRTWLGPSKLDVKIIGPSSHTSYFLGILKNGGCTTSYRIDKELEQPDSPRPGRIAIVGMAGKGPESKNAEELWDVIMSKRDLCEVIPRDRFAIDDYYCKEHGDECTTKTKYGCFMDNPGHFDSRFFKVSPREALFMDPGHRQFLMSVYESLEMAGYSDGPTRAIDPNRIAVFYGQSNDDWHMVSHHTLGCDAYTLQGAQRAFGAGRAAFQFKWEGPTYSLDSACASSSSAIHLACLSLQAKDIDMAVVGAANITGYPHSWTSLSKSGVLSDTGNCKTFREDADGYCRADFVGSIVLKRLEDAERQHDNILAVVASSGRNHSGNASSITTSDAGAQERLFRKILQTARVAPADVSYVEMHGTGTQTGDPAEMTAITNTFRHRHGRAPLAVGGIKANIGHSEAAAGLSSLLKCIMMLQKNVIPPQAGLPNALNPRYPALREYGIDIPTEPKAFLSTGSGPRRCLLNNFDAAGGNASILLEDVRAKSVDVAEDNVDPRPCHVIVISARTSTSLAANRSRLLAWLRQQRYEGKGRVRLQDVAYTTTARRVHHPLRLTYTASSCQELISQLEQDEDAALPPPAQQSPSPVVFVFTGQGSHYFGMGSHLYATSMIFASTADLCARVAAELGFPPFLDIITASDSEASLCQETLESQLAVITLEISLAAFLRSIGVEPKLVTGHSLGEYAALHVAGVLSLADVLYLVGQRASLLTRFCEPGTCGMLAVSAPTSAIQELLETMPNSSCSIACSNSPKATVVSGLCDDLVELQAGLKVPSKMLSVPYGFHSLQIDPILEEFTALASAVTFSSPRIPVASTLFGSIVDSIGVFNAGYLARQAREPVKFLDAVCAIDALKLGNPLWIEIGPDAVCTSFVRATLAPPAEKLLSTLDRKTEPWLSVSKVLAEAYRNGNVIDWYAFHAPYETGLKLLALPTYAWDVKDYWITYKETSETRPMRLGGPAEPPPRISSCAAYVVHESISPNLSVTLRASIASPDFKALVDGHKIRQTSVVPGSVFCEAGIATAAYALKRAKGQIPANSRLVVRSVSLKRPLTRALVGTDGELHTTVIADGASGERLLVSWKAVSERSAQHDLGSCTIIVSDVDKLRANWAQFSYFPRARAQDLRQSAKEGNGHRMQSGIFYALFANTVEYDPAFKCIKEAFVSNNFDEATADIVLHNDPSGTSFAASPYWGESLVHLGGFLVNANPSRIGATTTFMMDSFNSFEQATDIVPGRSYCTYVRVSDEGKDAKRCDVFVFDGEEMVIQCCGLHFHEVDNDILDRLLGKTAPMPLTQPVAVQAVTMQLNAVANTSDQQDATVAQEKNIQWSHTQPEQTSPAGQDAFSIILDTIANATGNRTEDLTDDTGLMDLGVDSIMGIEIASRANDSAGLDLLPSFMMDYPTIRDLRAAFGEASATQHAATSKDPSVHSVLEQSPELSAKSSATSVVMVTPPDETDSGAETSEKDMVIVPAPADDDSPAPGTRITLLSGRTSSGKRPLYLIADGTGSIATYIHLPPFKSKMPVYGIDSPYLRCPSRLAYGGIEGAAHYIVQALLKFQSDGPFFIGGFSGGAMIGHEVCRQLVAAGRTVDKLLLIDMCCPRSVGSPDIAEVGWKVYESIANQGGMWSASLNTQQHLRNIFGSVARYHPQPMKEEDRPKRVAMIWAKKGLIDRCSGDLELGELLKSSRIPTTAFPGFMEDPKMGAIAWGLPHKTEADLGSNGWDKFVGKSLNLAIDADHLEMPTPSHVHLLHEAMVKALTYLDGSD